MNIKQYFWPFIFILLILSGLFSYLILNNISTSNYLSQVINDSRMIVVIKKIIPSLSKRTPEKESIKILFGGDVSFDRYIRQVGNEKGYDFMLSNLTTFLEKYDEIIVNFESPITKNPSISMNSESGSRENYIFTSDPKSIDVLIKNNISIVNIGNNHIGNFGKNGYEETTSFLDSSDISYFGNTNYSQENTYLIKEIDGVSVGLVNFNQFISDGYEKALNDLSVLKDKVDILIVFSHWDNEYEISPSKITQDRARKFIDEGVDVVIGSHPHVVSSHEVYEGKHIYYSLGNFIFDQYFSPETKRGLLLELKINIKDHSLEFKEHFISMNTNGQTTLH